MIRFTRWIARTAAVTTLVALSAASAFAQGGADKVVRIGYQKAGLLSVIKAQGSLEARLCRSAMACSGSNSRPARNCSKR